MTAFPLMAAVLLAVPAGGGRQDPPEVDPGARWKLDVRLSLEEREGAWVFTVEGTTDLPAGIRLRARVYAVEVVEDFRRGRREDEEPLVWEGDEEAGQAPFQDFLPEGGRFRVEVYRFRRRPWSILYRGRVHYLPKLQDDEEILKKAGDQEFSRHGDLRWGTPRSFGEELSERRREATEDLVRIDFLFRTLKEAFEARVQKPDPAAWKAWKEDWYSQLERLAERNRERYGLWAVWFERQVKMRWGGMCDLLRQILAVCSEYLEGEAEALERARKRMEGFQAYLEEAIDVCGIDFPLDLSKVVPALEAYQKGFAPLRAWLARPEGDGTAAALEARRACGLALFRVTPHIRVRRRAYQYLNEVAAALARLVDLVRTGAGAEALRKALEEHDSALEEFRRFAGLK